MTANRVASRRVVALVAAYNEEGRIGPTVEALAGLADVEEVVVVADGTTDRTVEEARAAGARVLAAPIRQGKGRALDFAVHRIPPAEVYVLVDGDVENTAAEAGKLLEPVLAGRLDVSVGRLPSQAGGGFGLVKRLARWLIRTVTSFEAVEPLSGQRAITRSALQGARPLAGRFGTEVGMTMDVVRLGFRVGEIPVRMAHRSTGRGVDGFIHRGRQGFDILSAAVPRMLGLR